MFVFLISTTCNAQYSEQRYLTGNWGGVRDSLEQSGISFQPRATVFYQGTDNNKHDVSGKTDMKVNFNGLKIGLSKWTLSTQVEYNFGESINHKAITLYPMNMAMFQPGTDGVDRFDVSSYFISYAVSKPLTIRFGKFNMIEIAAENRFQGGAGMDAPMNASAVATPTGIIPPYMLGAIVGLKVKAMNYTLMVYDPQSYVNKNNFKHAFKDVSFSLNLEFPVKIAGMSGSQNIRGAYSTQGGIDLNDINIPGENIRIPEETRKYFFSYYFNQYIMLYDQRGAGMGIYGSFNVSDGSPNPIRGSATLGLGGNSFIHGRTADFCGLGLFYVNMSKGLKEFSSTRIPLGNEYGVEIYYNYTVNKWWTIGSNLQWVNSGIKVAGNVFCWGLRTRVIL